MKDIRVAIVGVGNCASSLVQGVTYYRNNPQATVGLMHPDIAGLKVADIHFACAFDVDARKVSQPLARAVFAPPNCAKTFCDHPDADGAKVFPGPLADGVASHLERFDESLRTTIADPARSATKSDVVRVLKETKATVLVNYLPVGSQHATELYAEACLEAGVGMVNCIPVFIGSDPAWAARFKQANLPLVGDDVKSQFGATVVHRVLMKLAQQRGMAVESSYQLNVGGNADFLNMLERSRLTSKKVSKTESVTSQVPMDENKIHIGPSDFVPFLGDNKVAYVRMNVRGFGGVAMEADVKLSVEDSPNSAGVVVDAIRYVALAQRAGIGGVLEDVSAVLMKRPLVQREENDAADRLEQWTGKTASTHP
ncbi:MAG TPA: inositol-3-phosphate synthase [Phycisphaerae bacterium]|nr:inositol-3-phosphate synthase [Phycisphaerae bacterium]